MEKIRLLKKTGFVSDVDIFIFDAEMKPFYFKRSNGKRIYFNLPKGKYFCKNEIHILNSPVKYKLPKLPKPEIKVVPPKTFPKIIYGNNPHKCSIFYAENKILFDNSFKDLPRFIISFIIYHEFGHFAYRGNGQQSEKNCDTFARYMMLKNGYNPSQVHFAIKYTLDGKYSTHRIDLSKKENLQADGSN